MDADRAEDRGRRLACRFGGAFGEACGSAAVIGRVFGEVGELVDRRDLGAGAGEIALDREQL
ncbi:MAG: hypothetical protein AAFQ71_03585 [Planctomycetota bacterium]